jgi:hypothetical protein
VFAVIVFVCKELVVICVLTELLPISIRLFDTVITFVEPTTLLIDRAFAEKLDVLIELELICVLTELFPIVINVLFTDKLLPAVNEEALIVPDAYTVEVLTDPVVEKLAALTIPVVYTPEAFAIKEVPTI